MGSSTSKPGSQDSTLPTANSNPDQVLQQTASPLPIALNTNPKQGTDILPPTACHDPPPGWDPYGILSEQPPKQRRFPWRRKTSFKPVQQSAFTLSSFPQAKPLSPCHTSNFDSECSTPASQCFSPLSQVSSRTTVDASPAPKEISREDGWNWDTTSHDVKSSVSSPNLTLHARRIPRRPLRRSSLQSQVFAEPPESSRSDLPNIVQEENVVSVQNPYPSEGIQTQPTSNLPYGRNSLEGASSRRGHNGPFGGLIERGIKLRRIRDTQGERGSVSNSGFRPHVHSLSASELRTTPKSNEVEAPLSPLGHRLTRQEKHDRRLAERLQREEFAAANLDLDLGDDYLSNSDSSFGDISTSESSTRNFQLGDSNRQDEPSTSLNSPNSDDLLAQLLQHEELAWVDRSVLDGNTSPEAAPTNRSNNPYRNSSRNPFHSNPEKRRLSDKSPINDPVIHDDADFKLAKQLHEEELQLVKEIKTRDCAVCGDAIPLPDFPALMDCEHEPQTCADCYQGWIESELNGKAWDNIKCPEHKCKVVLRHCDVQSYATPEVFSRFDLLSALSAINDCENFRWCLAPSCKSGQEHLSGVEGNIFRCVACGFRVCIIHSNTWHEGETCEEYDYRVSGRQAEDQKRQEAASALMISESTKKCPGRNCTWNIEKNDGCDHMTCSKCSHEFCWVCLAPYDPIRRKGNSAHKSSCKYHSSKIN